MGAAATPAWKAETLSGVYPKHTHTHPGSPPPPLPNREEIIVMTERCSLYFTLGVSCLQLGVPCLADCICAMVVGICVLCARAGGQGEARCRQQ